jgi:alpha-D-ribose 1-methylphosphonate 5-triphosphate synthase subunit PhnL
VRRHECDDGFITITDDIEIDYNKGECHSLQGISYSGELVIFIYPCT